MKLACVSCVYICLYVCHCGSHQEHKASGTGHPSPPLPLDWSDTIAIWVHFQCKYTIPPCILLPCVLCIISTHLMSFVHLYIVNSGPKYKLNYYHFCNINYHYLGIKTKYSRIDLKYFTSGEIVLDPEKGPRRLIENLIRNNKKQRSGIFLKIIAQSLTMTLFISYHQLKIRQVVFDGFP